MFKLDNKIPLNEETIKDPNLCHLLTEKDCQTLGNYIFDGYQRDKSSRFVWEKRTSAGMNLAMQITKDKNFPWPNCSNIAFPLVTIATQQFHARAYPAIIQGSDVVKCRVIGEDLDGSKSARAKRISTHMSYQVLEEDVAWEEQHDRMLINVAIVGCAFTKSYYSPSKGHNVSELVVANDLVLDYYARSVESAARKTHVIPLYRNEIHERVQRGSFRNVLAENWFGQPAVPQTTPEQSEHDKRTGQTPPQPDEVTPFTTLEQHVNLDLDGDGYAEPYIATIELVSKSLLRLVTRFERMADIEYTDEKEVICIHATEYFTKHPFIPSPDGGIYDLGFGVLLGPLNESASALINQLVDAGTMSNSAGGFLGRGAKIRGGVYTFAPLEWKRVDSTGEDLSKSIFPLPVREPSAVLFNLLSLLINYTNRVGGSVDATVGENPGQNTPAETQRSMIEQGGKIYSAIFKRVWRSMKNEFKKLYVLNGIYLPAKKSFGPVGNFALREDYLGDPNDVVPVADPNITSDTMILMQAQALKHAAMTTNGYDLEEVERRYLRALHIDAIDMVYPGLKSGKVQPLPNPKVMVENIKSQRAQLQLDFDKQSFIMELMEERKLNQAKILELMAKSTKELADAEGEKDWQRIAAFQAHVTALKSHDEMLTRRIELMMKQMEMKNEQGNDPKQGGLGLLDRTSDNQGSQQSAMAGNTGTPGGMV